MPPFSPASTVVVLGAGATRGAQLPDGRACEPPLNADFFTQLQRITAVKHQDTLEGVIDDILQVFGPDFSLTLEDYFTHLESSLPRRSGRGRRTTPSTQTRSPSAEID